MDPSDVATVFVAGASGGTGRATLRLLSSRVPTVRALTSTPSKTDDLRAAGADEVVVDDLLNPTALTDVLSDVDVVLSAVGSNITDVWSRDEYVDGAGTMNLLDAAVDADVEAFVMESAIGVGDEPASPLATAFDTVIQPIQRAKAEAEAAIREVPIRHTILRPGVLTNGPRTDTVSVADPGAKLWGSVSRADVARLMIAAPVTPAAEDRTLEVVSKPSFPNRALDVEWQLPRGGGHKTVSVETPDDIS
ncbi:NAD(P)-binding oxidoreductase [Haloarcula rubripromontorii]|uniref:3-beta hydroxysteroid dehydrogenase n=1 Tax=Haloarcula rubripromontorii TaxID=1705562 RepID=A0A0M9AKL0_9EURY|nr:NAD(P)-binding oxidoreductase [Haloarcula rubripromontorii]KOX92541.1 3-beta hydroxysteroid dehydrogenase [Haloarcula rubripromontorii]NLV04677.1 NAD(P)H-binding protein [Haloarcula rubripromontorii]